MSAAEEVDVEHATSIVPAGEFESAHSPMKAICSCGWESGELPLYQLAEVHEAGHLISVGAAIVVHSSMTGHARIVLVHGKGAKLR